MLLNTDSNNLFINTNNQFGVMHNLNPIAKAFVECAKDANYPVMDIGAAYGVATLPVLASGKQIVACDIDPKHLQVIQQEALKLLGSETDVAALLQVIHGKFPHIVMPTAQFDAILMSHVLPFLTGSEIEAGIHKAYEALRPGGKLFILSYTIYNKLMKNYINRYQQRKLAGDKWPGFLEDASTVWDSTNPLSAILPKQLNHCDPDLLEPVLINAGFTIDFIDYLNIKNFIPETVHYDGRETVGIIAVKR